MAASYRPVYLHLFIAYIGIASLSIPSQGKSVIGDKRAIVLTKNGFLQGEVINEHFYRFSGIPFAEPPVGNLRFEAPVKRGAWVGVWDATKHRSHCIQGSGSFSGSEDCLYLRIYTPKAPNPTNKLPVIVWIHGGAFFNGQPNFDDAHPEFFLGEDVIIATIHYRVGLFGFLSTGDYIVPGNAGLKDQIMALEWIKDNVENFGGDPEKITLLGQSAGSASIAYMLQAPQTKGLYSAAIMLSGSSLDTWTLTRNPLSFAQSVTKNLNIPVTNTLEMILYLKRIPAELIQNATASQFYSDLLKSPLTGLPLGPVTEPEHLGAVITGKSHDLLKRGLFNEVPIIMGHTSLEAHSSEKTNAILQLLVEIYKSNPTSMVPISLKITNPIEQSIVGAIIKTHYFGLSPVSSSKLEMHRWVSEDQFVRGIQEAVKLYSKKVPVYYYNFAYEGKLSGVLNRTLPGVGHSEDLYYLFDFGHSGSERDYLVRSRLVKLIANFAKYRNPTPISDFLLGNFQWPANFMVPDNEIKQVNITDEFKIVVNPDDANMGFWKIVFDLLGQFALDTY